MADSRSYVEAMLGFEVYSDSVLKALQAQDEHGHELSHGRPSSGTPSGGPSSSWRVDPDQNDGWGWTRLASNRRAAGGPGHHPSCALSTGCASNSSIGTRPGTDVVAEGWPGSLLNPGHHS
ncbi:MAG TPA: hypothetical protein VI094_00565 [Propionibacteriaceae bacterium]